MSGIGMTQVGKYRQRFNKILGTSLPEMKIYKSDGFEKHVKKKHAHCAKYIKRIPEIIRDPDYIGINPSVDNSIELVKRMEDNVLLAVKLDEDERYFYTASMYIITNAKLEHRVFGGRLKKAVDKAA